MVHFNKYIRPAAIWIVAFVVRVAYVFEIRANDPTFTMPPLDGKWHLQWALGIVQGDFWGDGVFFRAPLYPYFLALLIKILGVDFLAIKLAQAAIGATTALLVYLVGKRIAGSRSAIFSGLVAAFYAPMIYFDGELLIETIYLPLLCGSLLLAATALEKDSRLRWAVSGFVMGMAAIARPNVLVFAPILMLWIAYEKRWKSFAVPAVAWALAFAVPVAAVTIRNGVVGGEYVVVASQGGVNFYIGNNADSDGKTATAPAHYPTEGAKGKYRDSVDLAAEYEAERVLGRKLGAGEISKFWFDKSFRFVFEQPGAWIKLSLKKTYFFFNGYEIPSNRELYRVRDWAPLLKLLLLKEPLALPFGLLMPLALAGAALLLTSRDRYSQQTLADARLLAAFVVVYSATVIGFFVTARHRVPIVPLLIPFAALAVFEFVDLARKKSSASKMSVVVAAAVFVVGFGIANSRFAGVRVDQTREFHMALGDAFFRLGRLAEAEAEIREAIRVEPTMARAWINLGVLYLETKNLDRALEAMTKAVELEPNNASAITYLGMVRVKRGEVDAAIETLKRAIDIAPLYAPAHYNLAQAYRKIDDLESYFGEIDFAASADPYYVPANLDLAHILIGDGQIPAARKILERILTVEPNNKRALEYLRMIER